MRLIELPDFWTILLDFIAWFAIHMGCAILALKLPDTYFNQTGLYKSFAWEADGLIWQRIFRVKRWKNYLPDGAAFFKKGFRKKQMQTASADYYQLFIRESRRAEFTHWLAMLPAPLFFLWNPVWVGFVMIAYAILANGPCIIAQRYNRPRFERLLAKHNSVRTEIRSASVTDKT